MVLLAFSKISLFERSSAPSSFQFERSSGPSSLQTEMAAENEVLCPLLSPQRLFKKHQSGKRIQSSGRASVLNVYANLRKENPRDSIRKIAERTAELTGVSSKTVHRIKARAKAGEMPSTPGKTRPGAVGKRNRLRRYDDFTLSALRRKVHSYFLKNDIPTVKKLLCDVNEDQEIFPKKISMSTLYRLLKDLGFSFKKRNRNSILIDRNDIVLWRRRYLRDIKRYRQDNRNIYYLDETWANAGHTKSKVWQDTTVKSRLQAKRELLTTGLKAPSGKGSRLILTHAGNVDGFVPGAEDVFRGKKGSGDYHEEMDGNHFESWFKNKLLPNVKPSSVIVMDNASYHSVKVEKIPVQSWNKADIQGWLTKKQILWEPHMVKPELLEKVASVKEQYNAYRIDTHAALAGHTVLRLPPYHCELNPIELIWSQIKGHVSANNTSFKIKDVEVLLKEGIAKVTPENWKSAIKHVEGEEDNLWRLDSMIDDVLENQSLVINLESSDCDDSGGSDGEISGIEELNC